jgi:hypothetical protein
MAIFHYKFVGMQKIPNFASLIGIWMNKKYGRMRAPVNLFMRSVSNNNTTVKLKYPIALNKIKYSIIIFVAITSQHDVVKFIVLISFAAVACDALAATHVKSGAKLT